VQVVARRIAMGKEEWDEEPVLPSHGEAEEGGVPKKVIFDEVVDVIDLPGFSFKRSTNCELSYHVTNQLRAYFTAVAKAYHGNPMHCLQYASAVMTHLSKLLLRVGVKHIEQEENNSDDSCNSNDDEDDELVGDLAPHLHNHTFGITSDPLTQFGLVLAAFIHAVDHTGISNSDLTREDPELSTQYRDNSIIEQRSFEKAWKKLMEPSFYDLRRAIYSDEEELKRFRQVMVNSVLSTDVDNSELQYMRTARWVKALNTGAYNISKLDINRKVECAK